MIHRPVTYLPNTHGKNSYQSANKNLQSGPQIANDTRQVRNEFHSQTRNVQNHTYVGNSHASHQPHLISSAALSSRTVLGKEALKNKRDNHARVRIGICFLNSMDAEAYAEKLIGTGYYQVVVISHSHASTTDVVAIVTDHCVPNQSSPGIPKIRIRRQNSQPCSCCQDIESHSSWSELLQQIEHSIDQTGVTLEQIEHTAEEDTLLRTTHAARRGLPAELDSLTKRELDILQLVGKGMSVRDMAEHLQLAESTIGNHKYRLMKKLDAKTSLELLRIAVRCGLADLA